MPSWRSVSPIFPGFRACLKSSSIMKIIDVQRYNYRLPLLNSFTTAHGVMTAREGIIVQVTTERGISGVGEIAPLPESGGGSLADVCSLLPALVARLHGRALDEALNLVLAEGIDICRGEGGGAVRGGPLWSPGVPASAFSTSTFCGLEIALLDALGKAEGCGVCTLLSPVGTVPRSKVPVNAVISARTMDGAIATAWEAIDPGFQCVKLKVGLGGSVQEEVKRVAAVRDAIGPTMHLRLDANEAWNLEEAIATLSQCVLYDIQYVEQPLKAHDLA